MSRPFFICSIVKANFRLLPLGISYFPLPNGYWASFKIPLRLASFTTHLRAFHIEIYGGDGLALVPQELVKA